MGQSLKTRIKKLEGALASRDPVLMVAMRYPDGSFDWNGELFHNEDDFHAALDKALGKTDELFIIISKNKPLVIMD